jgi:hypothetical protein
MGRRAKKQNQKPTRLAFLWYTSAIETNTNEDDDLFARLVRKEPFPYEGDDEDSAEREGMMCSEGLSDLSLSPEWAAALLRAALKDNGEEPF